MLHEPFSLGNLTSSSSQSTCPSLTISLPLYTSASIYMSVYYHYHIFCLIAFPLSRDIYFIFLQFQRLSVHLLSLFLLSPFYFYSSTVHNLKQSYFHSFIYILGVLRHRCVESFLVFVFFFLETNLFASCLNTAFS